MSTLSGAKKMGRPPRDTEAVNVRMDRKMLDRLDCWRANEPGIPTRPEAMRRLVAKALGVK